MKAPDSKTKVKIILKDKSGKKLRELIYPVKNAAKLISFNSGWILDDDKKFVYKDGQIFVREIKEAPGQTTKK